MVQQGQITTFTISEKETDNTNLVDILKKYLFHWPLYLIGIGVFLTAALIYLHLTPPVFEVKTTILIKDEKKGQNPHYSALKEIDVLNSSKIIENEIEILKSKKLITKVVQDLGLCVKYKQKEGFKTLDIYGASPINFILIKPNGQFKTEKWEVIIKDDQHFGLKMPGGEYKIYYFNRSYRNKLGTWKIEAHKNMASFKGKPLEVLISNEDETALSYQKSIDASLISKLSTAIVLTIDDQAPKRGKDILNRLILNYNLETSNEKNKDIKSTLDFLDQKIVELSGDLGEAEKDIEGFKSSKGLTDIGLQTQVSLQNLQANDVKLNEANIQLNSINTIDSYVNAAENSEKVPSANGISDQALTNLLAKLSLLQLQYQELTATTPETSPAFEPIQRQIQSTKATIKESVKNIKSSLQATRDKLGAYNNKFESSIRNIPTQERQYIEAKRQQSSKEKLYTYYLEKREEVAANYAATLSDGRIIDQAYSALPKDSTKKVALAFAFMLGLAIPTGLIFTRQNFSNKVLSLKQITAAVKFPVIAELPEEINNESIAINDQFTCATSEQFRALRTRLHYLHKDRKQGRVTLITSSIPGEGKSFISTNISLALAYAGRKTILLELDMRKPNIAAVFKLPKGRLGLSDYFVKKVSLKDIIQNSTVPSLQIISSGSVTTNPAELLEREELHELISELRKTYDDIIIDSPPAHLVPDAMIISPLTDACLYVIRQGITGLEELAFLNNLQVQQQLNNVNIVFNGTDQAKHGYGYNYSTSYYNKPTGKKPIKMKFKVFLKRF